MINFTTINIDQFALDHRRVKMYSLVGFTVNVLRLNHVNLFDLTCDAINVIKKKDLVDYIEKIKGKVVADNQIQNLCREIANLSDNVTSLASTSERLVSELTIVKNVNNMLENRMINLEKQLSKNEQYGRCTNVEISGISN